MKIKIISGGQTGADRAALDAAIELGLDYGGAIPRGRLTENGSLDLKYKRMTEIETEIYSARTEKNVVDSDATLLFTLGRIGEGTALTMKLAERYNKPHLHIELTEKTDKIAVGIINKWLKETRPSILNVAGSRESTSRGVYARVYSILKNVLKES